MNDTPFDSLLSGQNDETEASEKKDRFEIAKEQLRDVCKSFLVTSVTYNPVETVECIQGYLSLDMRFMYSEISGFVYGLDDENLLMVNSNLEKLLQYAANSNCDEVKDAILKLYDHFHLALSQIQQIYDSKNLLVEEIKAARNEIKAMKEENAIEIGEVKKEAEKEAKRMQREYIAILGIFASIVLTFVGALTFSASVLENINAASVYRLFFVIILLALVLFNVLAMLMRFISNMCDNKFIQNITIGGVTLKWMNIILLIIAGAVLVAWFFHAHAAQNSLGDILPWVKKT